MTRSTSPQLNQQLHTHANTTAMPSTKSHMQTRRSPLRGPREHHELCRNKVLPIAGCPKSPKGLRGGPRQGHGLGLGCLQTHLIVACTERPNKAELSLHGNAARQSRFVAANHFPFSIIFSCHAKDKRNVGLLCVLNSTLSSQLKMYTVVYGT